MLVIQFDTDPDIRDTDRYGSGCYGYRSIQIGMLGIQIDTDRDVRDTVWNIWESDLDIKNTDRYRYGR